MARLDRDSHIPLHAQIKEAILRDIVTKHAPGDQLPTELEYVRLFKASSLTVARALQELQKEGYVSRHRGRGTFVSDRTHRGIELVGLLREADDGTVSHLGGLVPVLCRTVGGDGPISGTILTAPLPSPAEFHASCIARGIGGAIAVGFAPEHYEFVIALAKRMPVVLLNKRIPGFAADVVGPDERGGARKMVDRYLTSGAKRFAFITRDADWHPAAKDRLDGFRERLAEVGLAPDETLVGDWDAGMRDRLAEAWRSGNGPEAVIASSAGDALAALDFARGAGVTARVATFTLRWASVADIAGHADVAFVSAEGLAERAGRRLRERMANPLLAPETFLIDPSVVPAGSPRSPEARIGAMRDV